MAQKLSNLPIGAKVKFGTRVGGIKWLIVAKNHYDNDSVTLFAEKVIEYLPYDAIEPTNPDSDYAQFGNARYSMSNIKQWLNNRQFSNWYSAQHTYDAVDTTMQNTLGFTQHFTDVEYNAIKVTSVISIYGRAGGVPDITDTITEKIFLPSSGELNIPRGSDDKVTTTDGTPWGYPTSVAQLQGYYTNEVATKYGLEVGKAVDYWTRSSHWTGYHVNTIFAYHSGVSGGTQSSIPSNKKGVRPALNLPTSLSVSDTTDSEGYYTFNWNSAPPAPTTLTVPTVYGGKSTTISWSGVTDPDGNSVTYQLEQSINDGAFTTLYTGTNIGYTTIVPFGTTRVQYRVKATDSLGASSGYNTSSVITVINNTAPVISGSDGNLGTKTNAFTQTYSVTDANGNAVTITEAIDGVNLRSYTATLGATNTFSVTGNTWLTLANGIHTLTITATDGIDKSVRTYTFTKTVTSFTIQRATAIEASAKPARIKVTVIKTIPPEATFKVEVCNNGFDANPTWEDATSVVLSELAYAFTNTTKTATKWGVNIRVTVARNNGSGACYVTSIGGNWE